MLLRKEKEKTEKTNLLLWVKSYLPKIYVEVFVSLLIASTTDWVF